MICVQALTDMNGYRMFFDSVIPIAQNIPFGVHGLLIPPGIRGPGHETVLSTYLRTPDVLPVTPGKRLFGSDPFRGRPRPAPINGNFDPGDLRLPAVSRPKNGDPPSFQVLS